MNTRNSVIVLTRFLSMVFIILCHIIYYYEFIPGNMALVQVFNVGVYIFLIISGYLYGGKFISNFKNWILKRWSKIVIPVIILVIIDIMLLLLAGETIKPISFFFYALNIQGLSTISNNIFSKLNLSIANLGTLWFTTIIMVCYCLVPILQKQIKEKCIQYQSIIIFALLLFNFILVSLFNISFIYFIVFYIGYTLSNIEFNKNNLSNKKYFLFTFVMLAMQIFRLYLKYKIDGTYVYLANVGISHTILSIWIFITMFKIKNHFPFIIELFVNSKLIIWFDEHSYYIYLVHGLFCMGNELNVYKTFNNIWVSTIIFILLTLGLSYVLRKISNLIIQKLNVEIDKKLS